MRNPESAQAHDAGRKAALAWGTSEHADEHEIESVCGERVVRVRGHSNWHRLVSSYRSLLEHVEMNGLLVDEDLVDGVVLSPSVSDDFAEGFIEGIQAVRRLRGGIA